MLTKSNKKELKQRIFDGPYVMTEVIVLTKPTIATQEAVPEHTILETYRNTTIEKHAYIDTENEAIHTISSGIRDDIYSIVDAYTTTKEIWIAIERLQLGESLNKQDVKTNLFWEFGKFNSRDENQLSHTIQEWSRFVMVVKQTSNLDTISYNKLFDILKQYHNKVNDIRVKRIAKNLNSLALVAATQQYLDDHYQAPKPYKTYAPSSKQTHQLDLMLLP
nr:hypothetical protein [Tanacetum cinerariifolium]